MKPPKKSERIFATANKATTSQTWDLSKTAKKGIKPSSGVTPGICAALAMIWIQKSIEKKSMILDASELASKAHFVAITQAAFEYGQLAKGADAQADERSLMDVYNLRDSLHVGGCLDQSAIVLSILTCMEKNPGFYFLNMSTDQSGHYVAFKVQDGQHLYFDPEEGCFQFKSRERFRQAVFSDIVENYAHLLGGDYRLYRVEAQ